MSAWLSTKLTKEKISILDESVKKRREQLLFSDRVISQPMDFSYQPQTTSCEFNDE